MGNLITSVASSMISISSMNSANAFRRRLPPDAQESFDDLWRAPKIHVAAGTYQAHEEPMCTVLMSMLLENQKKIRALEAVLDNPTCK